MAKKNQQQQRESGIANRESGEEAEPAKRSLVEDTQQIEQQAEAATAVAEHEGSGGAPAPSASLSVHLPDPAPLDVIGRIGQSIVDQQAEREALEIEVYDAAAVIAKGAPLGAEHEKELAAKLRELGWTAGMFGTLVEQHKNRNTIRAELKAAGEAEHEAEVYKADIAAIIAERDAVLAQFNTRLEAKRNGLALAESRCRIAADARKRLIETASRRTRTLYSKGNSAAEQAAREADSAQRRAQTALVEMNRAQDKVRDSLPDSEDRARAEQALQQATANYEAATANLAAAKTKAAELADEARELRHLCETE